MFLEKKHRDRSTLHGRNEAENTTVNANNYLRWPNMRHEYGIAVLKPDGNKQHIKEHLFSILKLKGITVVETSDKRLTRYEVEKNFAANSVPFDDYVDYMTSGYCHAILVHGYKVGLRLQELKKSFREQYGFTKESIANVLHTSDQGVEYYLQIVRIITN